MSASVITCVYTPPVFEFAEHVLDFVSLAIEFLVEAGGQYSSLSGRDARGDAFGLQGGAILVTVIAFVANHGGSMLWKCRICEFCTDMIAHLSFRKAQDQWPAITIAHGMEF